LDNKNYHVQQTNKEGVGPGAPEELQYSVNSEFLKLGKAMEIIMFILETGFLPQNIAYHTLLGE